MFTPELPLVNETAGGPAAGGVVSSVVRSDSHHSTHGPFHRRGDEVITKKIGALAGIALLALGLAACGSSSKSSTTAPASAAAGATSSTSSTPTVTTPASTAS